jgi:hypothetical protein
MVVVVVVFVVVEVEVGVSTWYLCEGMYRFIAGKRSALLLLMLSHHSNMPQY